MIFSKIFISFFFFWSYLELMGYFEILKDITSINCLKFWGIFLGWVLSLISWSWWVWSELWRAYLYPCRPRIVVVKWDQTAEKVQNNNVDCVLHSTPRIPPLHLTAHCLAVSDYLHLSRWTGGTPPSPPLPLPPTPLSGSRIIYDDLDCPFESDPSNSNS